MPVFDVVFPALLGRLGATLDPSWAPLGSEVDGMGGRRAMGWPDVVPLGSKPLEIQGLDTKRRLNIGEDGGRGGPPLQRCVIRKDHTGVSTWGYGSGSDTADRTTRVRRRIYRLPPLPLTSSVLDAERSRG